MGWREQLRPASFRGVPFKVDGDELAAGRRVQVHEYPQRDKPYVEDLGRATRKITLTAYVIGPDYMAARDRLLEAVETAGPGELVHPQYGTVQVVAEGECRVAHSAEDGGLCRFSLSFVEAGDLVFPSATANTAARLSGKANALQETSINDFTRRFTAGSLPDYVANGAMADLSAAVDIAGAAVALYRGGWSGLAKRVLGNLSSLIATPRALAFRIMGLFAALGDDGPSRSAALASGITGADLGAVSTAAPVANGFQSGATMSAPPLLAALTRLASVTSVSASGMASTIPSTTPARQQQAANSAAVAALVRQASLVQSARIVAAADWPVHDDAMQARDQLAARIDAEALRPEVSDDTFRALTDLRVAVVQDITTRAAGSARLTSLTPTTVQPAVVLAYDLYEDAERGAEIVTRNRVPHPGFVPPEPLKVLS